MFFKLTEKYRKACEKLGGGAERFLGYGFACIFTCLCLHLYATVLSVLCIVYNITLQIIYIYVIFIIIRVAWRKLRNHSDIRREIETLFRLFWNVGYIDAESPPNKAILTELAEFQRPVDVYNLLYMVFLGLYIHICVPACVVHNIHQNTVTSVSYWKS